MPTVEKSPVTAPNNSLTSMASYRSMNPRATGSPVYTDNASFRNGDPGGSMPQSRQASMVRVDNHQFRIANAQMGQRVPIDSPGKGAIPVQIRSNMETSSTTILREVPKSMR